MRGSNTDGHFEQFALALTLAASLLAATRGYLGVGFLLFIAAATPIPLIVGSWVASLKARNCTK